VGGRAGTDAGGAMLLTEGFLGWGFLGSVKRHRTDRRVKGWLRRNGWVEGWAGCV
jgi:hypothetical protein